MLEADGVLQAWRLALPPEPSAGAIAATALADHRVMYLDYQGPVSGNRGQVTQWDAGAFDEAPDSSPEVRKLLLKGVRLCVGVRLERVAGATWSFSRLPDG